MSIKPSRKAVKKIGLSPYGIPQAYTRHPLMFAWHPFDILLSCRHHFHNSPSPFLGQSELTATNAPVGRFVHWMGCVFSFGAGWGSWQSIFFCCWPLYFFFLVPARFSLDLTSHIATLFTFLPSYYTHHLPY